MRLLQESLFSLIDGQTLILQKMVGRKAFLRKSKHQCHLSLWREWVYGTQSWKETRLVWESMFISNEKWNLILKNSGKRSFSYETKAPMSFIPWGEYVYGTQSWKKRRLLWKSMFVLLSGKL